MKYGAASVIVNYKVRMELWRGLNVQILFSYYKKYYYPFH